MLSVFFNYAYIYVLMTAEKIVRTVSCQSLTIIQFFVN